MTAGAPRYYRLPCCGRMSTVAPNGHPCYACASAATPPDDPIAVAYRERCAARAAALSAPSLETDDDA